MFKRFLDSSLYRFLIVGGFSTIINYLFFYLLYIFLHVNYLFASAAGFLAGVAFGYMLNKTWTFRISSPSTKGLVVKYLTVYLVSLCLGLIAIHILIAIFKVNPLLANLFAIILTTCTNFIGTRLLVFRP